MLSSTTLFHYTDNFENLISILQNGFYPRVSFEKCDFGQFEISSSKAAIPMVCFCDIPLSKSEKHSAIYGKYSIGLNKLWAKRMKLNPLIYLNKNSTLSNSLSNLLNTIRQSSSSNNHLILEKYHSLAILKYIKPFQGEFRYRDKVFQHYKFYDENEWRYTIEDYIGIKNNPQIKFYDKNNYKMIDSFNEHLKKYTLNFLLKDINYITVTSEKERMKVTSLIGSNPKIQILQYSQILMDF